MLEILCTVIKPADGVLPVEASGEKLQEIREHLKETKIENFRNKIKAMSKMIKIFKTIRDEKETIMQLKGLCPDNKIPIGLIQQGKRALEGALDSFIKAKEWDSINEKRPE